MSGIQMFYLDAEDVEQIAGGNAGMKAWTKTCIKQLSPEEQVVPEAKKVAPSLGPNVGAGFEKSVMEALSVKDYVLAKALIDSRETGDSKKRPRVDAHGQRLGGQNRGFEGYLADLKLQENMV